MLDLVNIKKILIINTRSSDKKLESFVMWGAWAVASYFKANLGCDVVYLDENNEDNFQEKFESAVKDRDLVGFSLTSMQIKYSIPLMKYIRKNYPAVKIMVGGIHPVLFPRQDYAGLVDEVIDYDLPKNNFLYEFLPEKVKQSYHKKAQVVTGFNCSYKCAFCVNSVRNCKHESVPLQRVTNNIDYIVKEYNPKKIYFRDEDFYQDINKAKAIVKHIIDKNYTFNWDAASRVTHFRPGLIDDDFLDLMVKSGCKEVRFGVESGSQRMLNYLRKGQTVEQIKFAVRQCIKHGIHASCSMIIGIPNETAEDREQTYELISELHSFGPKAEILGPQIYRPYPGGILYEEIKKFGFNFPEKFEDWENYYDEENPVGEVLDTTINYPWLSKKENEFLPYIWVVAHYGLNYRWSDNIFKKMIGYWFSLHWKLRWFGGLDIKLFMLLRQKLEERRSGI